MRPYKRQRVNFKTIIATAGITGALIAGTPVFADTQIDQTHFQTNYKDKSTFHTATKQKTQKRLSHLNKQRRQTNQRHT